MNSSWPKNMKILNIFGNVMLVILVSLTIFDYLISMFMFNTIKDDISIIHTAYKRLFSVNNIVSNAMKLELLNAGINVHSTKTNSAAEQWYRDEINDSVNDIQVFSLQLNLKNYKISPKDDHRKLLEDPSTQLQNIEGVINYYNLEQAVKIWISRAFILDKALLATINYNNSDLFFTKYNGLNYLEINLKKSADFLIQEFIDATDGVVTVILVIMINILFILMMTALGLIIILSNIEAERTKILELFLDISDNSIKIMYNKLEKFVNSMQFGEGEGEAHSDEEGLKEDGDKGMNLYP